MTKFLRYTIYVFTALALQSCASLYIPQEMQGGKTEFEAGNYKTAFHRLLPLAAEGVPQAEYAVGYMYYYGYGVPQDGESGIFWIKRAAKQHDKNAIKALKAIERQKLTTVDSLRPSLRGRVAAAAIQKPLLTEKTDWIATAATRPRNDGQRGNGINDNQRGSGINDNQEKVREYSDSNQNSHPAKYTLQLFGSYHLSDVQALQAKLDVSHATYIRKTQHNNRDWYVLTYGNYSAIYLAKLAMDDLPKKIHDFKPWIRKTEALQSMLV